MGSNLFTDSEELRAEAHLRIGRLLAKHTPPEKLEQAIFEILNQVNRGAALLTFGPVTVGHLRLSQEERDEIPSYTSLRVSVPKLQPPTPQR